MQKSVEFFETIEAQYFFLAKLLPVLENNHVLLIRLMFNSICHCFYLILIVDRWFY